MIGLSEIERLLAEDAADGDVTTEALGFGARSGIMTFRARPELTLAGVEVARAMMAGLAVELHAADGDRLAPSAPILTARGPAADLHRVWKAAQTLLEVLCGIATATRALVDAVEAVDPTVRVATTRKSVPGVRRLSRLAVKAGGGILHRHGLAETVLVFEQHRAFLEGMDFAAIARHLRQRQPEKALGIEVATLAEALEAAEAGFDVIQLEKFRPDDIATLTDRLGDRPHRRPLLAAAGGIHPDNAAAFVAAGAELIVTSWPYTAKPADVAVRIQPA